MQKNLQHPSIGEIKIVRRKGTIHLKLSVVGDSVRLSIPYGVSEQAAIKFLEQKTDWITKHRIEKQLLKNGDRIGRGHRLFFEPYETTKFTSRIKDQTIWVRYPRAYSAQDPQVQQAAERGGKKALEKEAERILPERLNYIAKSLDRTFARCTVKFMKSRWGHCSNKGDITLNSYLVQTDAELIDYVIIHELAHTVHHDHSERFWNLVAQNCPDYKALRKRLKSKQTALVPNAFAQ